MKRLLLTAATGLCVLIGMPAAFAAKDHIHDDLLRAAKPAKKLSDYGLFRDTAARQPENRMVPYDLNSPLFTDYAVKIRYIYVPAGSAPAPYHETKALEFPVGSVLVKTFAYPETFERPEKNIRFIETRLLIHKQDGWKAYPYIWNEEQTEAYLKVAGKRLEIPVTWADGSQSVIPYAVPNVNQCKGCHTDEEKAFTPIGPKVRNLNKGFSYGEEGVMNQLVYLQKAGYLSDALTGLSKAPYMPDPFKEEAGDLFSRARSYLDGNCAHCHTLGRPADTSGLYLDYLEDKDVQWGVNKPPVAAGRGSGGLKVDIKPGAPEESILLYRMKSTDPGAMMPELGRSVNHEEGVRLIEEFIKNLK